jgi:hypothetical protein
MLSVFYHFLVGREIGVDSGLDTSAHLVEVYHRWGELGYHCNVEVQLGC